MGLICESSISGAWPFLHVVNKDTIGHIFCSVACETLMVQADILQMINNKYIMLFHNKTALSVDMLDYESQGTYTCLMVFKDGRNISGSPQYVEAKGKKNTKLILKLLLTERDIAFYQTICKIQHNTNITVSKIFRVANVIL